MKSVWHLIAKARSTAVTIMFIIVALPFTVTIAAPVRHLAPNSGWSTPLDISNTPGESQSSLLAAQGQSTIHVVWSDNSPGNYDVYYAQRISDGSWSMPENVSASTANSFA